VEVSELPLLQNGVDSAVDVAKEAHLLSTQLNYHLKKEREWFNKRKEAVKPTYIL